MAVACVIAAVITIVSIQIIGFDDPKEKTEDLGKNVEKKEADSAISKTQKREEREVFSPLSGKVIPLKEVHDEVFSSELMGKGCAVIPSEGKIYAPLDGKVVGLLESHHAVGIESGDGVEVLIHVGMDTVKLGGEGFTTYVEEGESVKKGQLLLEFDIEKIQAEGYEVTTPVIVANSDEFSEIVTVANKEVSHGEGLLRVN